MDSKVLNEHLKGVADAIRAKKGTSELINPQDFAEEISTITGGGGGELEGEYFLTKPNGRYKKIKFIRTSVNLENLSEDQKMAIALVLATQGYGACYSGFMCNLGAGSGTHKENFIGDPVSLVYKIGMATTLLGIFLDGGSIDSDQNYVLNDGTCFAWEERDVSLEGTTYSFIGLARVLLSEVLGYEPTVEEVYAFLQVEDVDKATYDEWKNR